MESGRQTYERYALRVHAHGTFTALRRAREAPGAHSSPGARAPSEGPCSMGAGVARAFPSW